MRQRNPAARLLADQKFHQRVIPRKLPAIGLEELINLEEWEDRDGQELDARETYRGRDGE